MLCVRVRASLSFGFETKAVHALVGKSDKYIVLDRNGAYILDTNAQ